MVVEHGDSDPFEHGKWNFTLAIILCAGGSPEFGDPYPEIDGTSVIITLLMLLEFGSDNVGFVSVNRSLLLTQGWNRLFVNQTILAQSGKVIWRVDFNVGQVLVGGIGDGCQIVAGSLADCSKASWHVGTASIDVLDLLIGFDVYMYSEFEFIIVAHPQKFHVEERWEMAITSNGHFTDLGLGLVHVL